MHSNSLIAIYKSVIGDQRVAEARILLLFRRIEILEAKCRDMTCQRNLLYNIFTVYTLYNLYKDGMDAPCDSNFPTSVSVLLHGIRDQLACGAALDIGNLLDMAIRF